MKEQNKVETISPMGLYAECGEKIAETIETLEKEHHCGREKHDRKDSDSHERQKER